MVYYFFQGHEDYMVQHSCSFFCGQSDKYPKVRTMPWLKNKQLRGREFLLCRVEAVEILFPSQRSLNLMKLYADTTSVTQTPNIVQRLTMAVMQHSAQSSKHQIKFTVDIFPNALPDFLVHQAVFEKKYEKY